MPGAANTTRSCRLRGMNADTRTAQCRDQSSGRGATRDTNQGCRHRIASSERTGRGWAVRTTNVRLGSDADIEASLMDVRFTPESGHQLSALRCPPSAKSGHRAYQLLACYQTERQARLRLARWPPLPPVTASSSAGNKRACDVSTEPPTERYKTGISSCVVGFHQPPPALTAASRCHQRGCRTQADLAARWFAERAVCRLWVRRY